MSGHSCDVKFSYFVHFFVALITLTVFSRRNKENGGFNKIWDILTFAVFGRRLGLALKCESDANKCESENGDKCEKQTGQNSQSDKWAPVSSVAQKDEKG